MPFSVLANGDERSFGATYRDDEVAPIAAIQRSRRSCQSSFEAMAAPLGEAF